MSIFRILALYKNRLESFISHLNADHIYNSWQTIAPPSTTMQSTLSVSSTASSQRVQLGSSENLCDSDCTTSNSDFNKAIGASITNISNGSCNLNQGFIGSFDTSSDDHHVSFSKNGTECVDFDADSDKSNTQIEFCAMQPFSYLTVPNDSIAVKARRSNSLTTGTNLYHQPHLLTSSTENLANIVRQQRSFSLTDSRMESRRSSLTSSGSEARLIEPCFPVHIGMSNIKVWLKGERLHKYESIFYGMTYDQLMNTTNEHLIELEVTEGARNKLVRCIQGLKQRYEKLKQMEQALINGSIEVTSAVDELKAMVVTPMKPIDIYAEDDVPMQFMKTLALGE